MAGQKEFDKSIIERKENVFANIAEIVIVVLIAVLAVVVFRTQASMARAVEGESMLPTYNSMENYNYREGIYDTVRITKFSKIRRGDIVTFESNLTGTDSSGKTYYKILIKRVIALGGDYLEFRNSGQGYLEVWLYEEKHDEPYKIDEPYLNTDASGKPKFNWSNSWKYALGEKIEVPKGCYFVMGDNRDSSRDSRYGDVGFIPFRKVEGKVYLVVRYGDTYINTLWNKVFG